jgi:hypothetical protein
MSVDGRRETKEDRRVIIYSNQVQGKEITTIALNLAVGGRRGSIFFDVRYKVNCQEAADLRHWHGDATVAHTPTLVRIQISFWLCEVLCLVEVDSKGGPFVG